MTLALPPIVLNLRQLASNDGVDSEIGIRLLDRFFGVFATACTLLLVVGTAFLFRNKAGSATTLLLLLAITLASWRISRGGNPARAATLFGALAWTVGTVTLYLGMPASISVFVLATAMVMAVVLGVRTGALFAASYLAAWLIYIVLEARGMAPPKIFVSLPGVAWFHNLVAILLLLLPIPDLIGRLRAAQVAAEAANRSKLHALTMMSRHIRGPMNGILGTAQLLDMGELDAEQRELLASLKSSATGLQRLLDRLLDYSSIEAGDVRLHRETFAWGDLMARLRSRYALDADAQGQTLVLALDPSLPATTEGDPTRALQLLEELLSNALASGATRVSLTVRQTAGEIELDVADNGPGISPERLPRLFEPFANASDGEGHGLGLPLAGALARVMGGTMEVESRPGDTRFRVRLPAA